MIKDISQYKTLVFDCDGVVLDSNKVKTAAFYEASKHYGLECANKLIEYHVANGGVSRYAKFRYFLTEIVGKSEVCDAELRELLGKFSSAVKSGLLTCGVAEKLAELRDKTPDSTWLIVSGGDQAELREVFKKRNIARYFNGGIYGSPDTKEQILAREIRANNIRQPALFLGDSKYDAKVAVEASIDFVFMTQWTEVDAWKYWLLENGYTSKSKLANFVD
ncbi:HAD family hydrolase [Spongiibacter marinus]|uniref:HAD family hydrolase n=1 Tax=Spongiibacter marinus TaxID=354246 RepID=UPI00048338E8|nr:HAD hydrolase-like protein [Spongiibacter marinus]